MDFEAVVLAHTEAGTEIVVRSEDPALLQAVLRRFAAIAMANVARIVPERAPIVDPARIPPRPKVEAD